MYNINNDLLLRCYLIVAWEAQASAEDIHSNIIHHALINVSIALRPSVAPDCDECMIAVNRLRVHRFPDGTSFRTVLCQDLKKFSRTGLARFRNSWAIFDCQKVLSQKIL